MPKFKITIGLVETRTVLKTYECTVEAPDKETARRLYEGDLGRDILEDPNLVPTYVNALECEREFAGSKVTEIPRLPLDSARIHAMLGSPIGDRNTPVAG